MKYDVTLSIKQLNKVRRAIKSLNDVRKELEVNNPENYINWYLEDNNNLNLMCDYSHSQDAHGVSNQDAVIRCFELDNAGGGGW
tara:strand:- start:4541 stop:4792 length:252 start_codon:yes stop_codon:yes gene_type:complete